MAKTRSRGVDRRSWELLWGRFGKRTAIAIDEVIKCCERHQTVRPGSGPREKLILSFIDSGVCVLSDD